MRRHENKDIRHENNDIRHENKEFEDFSLLKENQSDDSSFLINKKKIYDINSEELKEIDSGGLNICFGESQNTNFKKKSLLKEEVVLSLTNKVEDLIEELKEYTKTHREAVKRGGATNCDLPTAIENNNEVLNEILKKITQKETETETLKSEIEILKKKVFKQAEVIKNLSIFKKGYYKLKSKLLS